VIVKVKRGCMIHDAAKRVFLERWELGVYGARDDEDEGGCGGGGGGGRGDTTGGGCA
jgi:hypothetical protein